jgi:hypothetical protein
MNADKINLNGLDVREEGSRPNVARPPLQRRLVVAQRQSPQEPPPIPPIQAARR